MRGHALLAGGRGHGGLRCGGRGVVRSVGRVCGDLGCRRGGGMWVEVRGEGGRVGAEGLIRGSGGVCGQL